MDNYFARTVYMYLNAAKFHRDVLQIGKKYKAKLRTDIDMSKVIAGNMEHNHESDSRQIERKVLRVPVKHKAHGDVSARP